MAMRNGPLGQGLVIAIPLLSSQVHYALLGSLVIVESCNVLSCILLNVIILCQVSCLRVLF